MLQDDGVDEKRFDELAVVLGETEPTRRTMLRRAAGGGLAALLTALGMLEAGSTDVEAGRRRRRRRRPGGGGGGGGSSSSSSSSSSGGGFAYHPGCSGSCGAGSTNGAPNITIENRVTVTTDIRNVNQNTIFIVDLDGDGLPDDPNGVCAGEGLDCTFVPCCEGLLCANVDLELFELLEGVTVNICVDLDLLGEEPL